MLTDEQKAAGWIEHDGGPCPVEPDRPVKVMFRDGDTATDVASIWWWERDQDGRELSHEIIAYKIAREIEALEAENARLRAMIEKLAGYAGHDDDCQIMTRGVWSDPIPCICGYSEIARAALGASHD